MVATVGAKRVPVHRLAWLGFAISLAALLLAWYGSLHAEKHIAGSPLREARGSANVISGPGPWFERAFDRAEIRVFGDRFDRKVLELTERSKIALSSLENVAFVLPFVRGSTSALMGGKAMKAVEKSKGKYSGTSSRCSRS